MRIKSYRERLLARLISAHLDTVVAALMGDAPKAVRACLRCAMLEIALRGLEAVEGLSGERDGLEPDPE